MTQCQPKIGLILMIGLPGSGKTTIASRLAQFVKSTSGDEETKRVHLFSYDELIPISIQCGSDATSWKSARENVMDQVTDIVREIREVQHRESKQSDKHRHNTLFIIDDNMYYRSMRYEYFQLARNYGLSFCQLYLSQPVEASLLSNRLRSSAAVPEEVVQKMAKRLQPPNSQHNLWERNSLTIAAHGDVDIEDIYRFVRSTLAEPVQPLAEPALGVPPSTLHSVDLQLRKLVGAMIRATSGDGEVLRTRAHALNARRRRVLDRLRAGDTSIPAEGVAAFLEQEMAGGDD